MKKLIPTLLVLLALVACKNDKSNTSEIDANASSTVDTLKDSSEKNTSETNLAKAYPEELLSVFKTHGGLNHWKKMNNLCFEMKGSDGLETHTVSLHDRKSKIENKKWSIGFDGSEVWLLKHELGYEGNPRFYHNLMFYFYAMPFVLADPGINYTSVEPTELQGKKYEGIKISYNDGVGDSSKDEYILYYNPDTYVMEWLAYTVTFRDQKQSNDWHFVKYEKWQEVNGFQLPRKMVWWNVKDGKPSEAKSSLKFGKVALTETKLDAAIFEKPSEAEYVKP